MVDYQILLLSCLPTRTFKVSDGVSSIGSIIDGFDLDFALKLISFVIIALGIFFFNNIYVSQNSLLRINNNVKHILSYPNISQISPNSKHFQLFPRFCWLDWFLIITKEYSTKITTSLFYIMVFECMCNHICGRIYETIECVELTKSIRGREQ